MVVEKLLYKSSWTNQNLCINALVRRFEIYMPHVCVYYICYVHYEKLASDQNISIQSNCMFHLFLLLLQTDLFSTIILFTNSANSETNNKMQADNIIALDKFKSIFLESEVVCIERNQH